MKNLVNFEEFSAGILVKQKKEKKKVGKFTKNHIKLLGDVNDKTNL